MVEQNMVYYKSVRLINGKPKKVVVDETGKIINNNPSREDLRCVERYHSKRQKYTDEQLLEFLIQYEKENGRAPARDYFNNDPRYPSAGAYVLHFGCWQRALKLAGLDVDSMIRKGIIETTNQKARYFELCIIKLNKEYIDLSGENCNNPFDGICSKGKIYDAKSSKLYDGYYYVFSTENIYREEIEYYYFGAFSSDWTKLEYVWRVPGEMVDKDCFIIGLTKNWEHNIENMKEFEITDKFKGMDISKI